MFGKIEEGLEAYKTELKRYKEYTDGIKKKYPENFSVSLYDEPDHYNVILWDAITRGMEKALGLTPDEIEKYCLEAGMTVKKA